MQYLLWCHITVPLICRLHVSQPFFYQILPLWIYGEGCTDSIVKSKQFKQMRSPWWQMKDFSKFFTMVTDLSMFLWLVYPEYIKMQVLEFQKRIFISYSKVNHFTLSAVRSKQIQLQNSAWWHLIAFLQSFLMVTDFHKFLWMICPQYKKTWRTLDMSKIVSDLK